MSRLEFFDANCMVGGLTAPNPCDPPLTVEAVLAELEYFGIPDALVCQAEAAERDLHLGNARLLEDVSTHPGLRPSWVIPMHTAIDYPSPEEYVDEMLQRTVHAVRVWPPPYHGYLAEPWALGGLWDALAERRVPVLVAGSDLGRYPDQPRSGFSAQNLFDLCRRHPSHRRLEPVPADGRRTL